MQDLNFNTLVGAIALLGILAVLSVATLMQGSHDALIALISLVTGTGIGAGATTLAMVSRSRPDASSPKP